MKRLILGVAVVAVVTASGCSREVDRISEAAPTPTAPPSPTAAPLFTADLSGRNRLLTNEFAHWNPGQGVRSKQWDVTSGSLFLRDGVGWSGRPDRTRKPDAHAKTGTNSAVFRMTTRQRTFKNVRVDLKLRNLGLSTVAKSEWDGVHLFLRWQSQRDLYAVTLNRRDNQVIVKRKLPGGDSNGGHYATIGQAPYSVPEGIWQRFSVTVENVGDDVEFQIFEGDREVLKAVDKGMAMPSKADRGKQIVKAGAVGIRADNCEFEFSDFRVYPL
ncbi:hypothetical protein GCM10027589_07850 [Actinocorallia lasiicapitis]